jgi:hypothetical protein
MKTYSKLFATALLLAGCAGAPEWKKNIAPDSEYKINSVKTKLSEKCPAPNFMTEKQLSDEFAKTIMKTFCEKKKCVDKVAPDTIVMDINLSYGRTMMGEGISCGESYAMSSISYRIDLKKGGEVFYNGDMKGPFVPQRGLFGNLGRIATQLSFSGGPDNEKADLEYLMPGIAKQIASDLD